MERLKNYAKAEALDLAHREKEIDKNFIPEFAERIKLWLEIIELSNISQKAKDEFKALILNNSYLQSANKELKGGIEENVSWGLKLRDFISGLLGLKEDLKRKKEGDPAEIDALFINLRDDIWAFWEQNKIKKD